MIYPKVSIVTITYSHEKYILEAIKGVILQQYKGEIEFIISNDNSPDKTDEIISFFLAHNEIPSNIQILYTKHKKNVGIMPNFTSALNQCSGKYIALCDGDDYWTDPLKLQKQVDFLEKNDDYVLCFHKVNILKSNGEIVEDFITKVPENYQERETLAKSPNYIHTPSVVYRNLVKNQMNISEFNNSPIGDYFLYLILAQYGKIGYIKETMAVYRHGVGVYSSLKLTNMVRKDILLFSNLYSYEKDAYFKEIFYKSLQSSINFLADSLEKSENKSKLLNTRRHTLIEKIYRAFK